MLPQRYPVSNRIRKLTVREVESAKPLAERYELSDGRSALRLVVFPSGVKSWALRYRVGARPRKMTLGKFPALELADARDLASDALKTVAKGGDPGAEKIAEKRRVRDTVKTLAGQWVEDWQRPRNRPRYVAEVERVLRAYVYPAIGSRDVSTIVRRDVLDMMDKAGKRGRLVPNHVLNVVRPFFAWCVEREAMEVNPAIGIRRPARIVPRDRVLSDEELRAFLAVLPKLNVRKVPSNAVNPPKERENAGPLPWADFLELLALTAQRRGEVAGMRWDEIDWEARTWTLPAGRTKNSQAHVVPLARRAYEILLQRVRLAGQLDEDRKNALLVFPAERSGQGQLSGFGHMKPRLDALMLAALREVARERSDDPAKVELPQWGLHDLRRTAATGMAALGHPIHVVERVLNHVAGATTGGLIAVYQRHDFMAERRAALEAWAQKLQGLRP